MHLKRQESPKSWPVVRKGTKYLVKPKGVANGIPMLILLRDMLEIAQNRKEVKRAINMKNILLNQKQVKDEKNSAVLFDTISVIPTKKNYRLTFSEKGKFQLDEIKENETNQKIAKVINKKMLRGKKTQINLSDGRNFLSNLKCNVNDSVLINLKEKKIEKCISLKEKSKIFVFEGKHVGKQGTIEKIITEQKMVEADVNGNKINVLIKQLMVVE
jgi:small subunit ribosomal protein S4e